jgi:CDP-glucose 4,6-dehydratase
VIRSSGRLIRDYIYVEDAVDAYLAVADALAEGEALAGQGINVSYGEPQSVIELVGRILGLMGRPDLQPTILDEASHEIVDQYLDPTRARKLLGWTPRVTLDEGLARTIAWYRRLLAPER